MATICKLIGSLSQYVLMTMLWVFLIVVDKPSIEKFQAHLVLGVKAHVFHEV